MALGFLDYAAFLAFISFVVGFSMWVSRKEGGTEEYFLAGRKLTWWLIGISLIASNISTEHFVGMAGRGYELGLAIASYEWTAAATMVLLALFFLPKFLSAGIYTIPEYLEYRYTPKARGLMAVYMAVAYIFVAIASVLYAGALGLEVIFGLELSYGVWLIGIVAGLYTVWGGLRAVVWADLFNGLGLIFGGILVTVIGFNILGGDLGFFHGVTTFFSEAGDKLTTVKPWDHNEMPWVAVFIGGLWIPQIFYWGLNQFITQRTLGAKSVAEGQWGILFAAFLKLIIPFIIVFPGIMASILYASEIPEADAAYPYMIKTVLPIGLRGLMFAFLFGAVMSSLDSMLNSAATICTMDIYKRHIKQDADDRSLVKFGRILTAFFVVIGCIWAPLVSEIGGGSVFKYIQMVWGFISPSIVVVFLFGLFSNRTPRNAAVGAMLLGIPIYGICLWTLPEVAFLHHMAITFILLSVYMVIRTILNPLCEEGAKAEKGPISPSFVFAGALGSIVLGLHVYLFSTWTMPSAGSTTHLVLAAIAVLVFGGAILKVSRLPAAAEIEMPVTNKIDLESGPGIRIAGCLIIAAVAVLYIIFF